MPRAERLRRFLARADVRTTWILSGALLVAVSIPGALLYAYSSMEAMEEADRWFEFVLQVTGRELEEHGPAVFASESLRGMLPDLDAALRLRAPDGTILFEHGDWPGPGFVVPALPHGATGDERDLRSGLLLDRSNWLVGERLAASGVRVELALPLRHFASEISEIRTQVWATGLVAVCLMLVVGIVVTIRAFAPLRRATDAVRRVDTGSLDLRLASRHTGDPIDVHAEAVNRVLERLQAGFARIRNFSSDVAHELRTPLNRIGNVSEVALIGGGEREYREALEAIHESAEHLGQVVQTLLLLAEIDERRFLKRARPIDLEALVSRSVEVYRAPFEEADVKLVRRGHGGEIEGDRTLLDRLLANLLDNALAHAPRGSSVEIHALPSGDGISITVDDAGPGIPVRDRERVFDRFTRLGGSPRKGHGLGLALARAIAKLHGGSLRVEDSPLGGARFVLWLPAFGAGAREVLPAD